MWLGYFFAPSLYSTVGSSILCTDVYRLHRSVRVLSHRFLTREPVVGCRREGVGRRGGGLVLEGFSTPTRNKWEHKGRK